MVIDRYSRQTLFAGIGSAGQARLADAKLVVVGCGALGGAIATLAARAGIGRLTVIDRDFIEYHNLQRQLLFDERDIEDGLPKAVAAERKLRRVNSEIEVEGIIADVNFRNIESLLAGADVVLDGLDNFDTRFVVNDACLKQSIPWVYGGAVSSFGTTMNILPGESACFRCLADGPPDGGALMTCDTVGVIGPIPAIIASLQVTEALKILVRADDRLSRELVSLEVWDLNWIRMRVDPRKGCRACAGHYDFLDGQDLLQSTSLCGQSAVQVLPAGQRRVDFEVLAGHLGSLGQVSFNEFLFRFATDEGEMVVFKDGRAIVKNTTDEVRAKAFYTRFIGS